MRFRLPSFRLQFLLLVSLLLAVSLLLIRSYFLREVGSYRDRLTSLELEKQLLTLYQDLHRQPTLLDSSLFKERVEGLLTDLQQVDLAGTFVIRELQLYSGFLFVFLLFMVLLLFFISFNLITRPLLRLEEATQLLARGDFSVRVRESRVASVNRLIRSFNGMIEDLVRGRRELLETQETMHRRELEQQRLEEELQFARRVQEGFLPRVIPPTEGLEVAAHSRFCLEAAGDYYDIIPLEEGLTVLAVGDVSGKGAGAALVMANLQAALRTSVSQVELGGMVSSINDLIHHNTPPELFITFVVAVYSARSKRLRYVNAGHNPPLLLRRDGSLEKLERGGLLLGALPRQHYDVGEVQLAAGDCLFMYTDGLSEAENPAGEMFGDDRVAEFLRRQGRLSPGDFLERLEEKVVGFQGREEFADDLTMLSAKVL